ncbi:YgfZ/GcvT domain-containing protein [Nocardioides sp.]|uniref:CAF17-like 4Fe-4S cluster assembly/insertion protein YgfZ n=1 Tax=Nocardioides sp. TaxID=35761 RepID=UPI003D11D6B2
MLDVAGAVAANGIDARVAAHYGSFNAEQLVLEAGDGFVDLSHRDVLRVAGPDRLSWLHSITTQYFTDLPVGRQVTALILSPQGHVEHAFTGIDDGEAFTAHTEPGAGAALIGYLERMKFMTRVDITDESAALAVSWRPVATDAGVGKFDLVPREQFAAYAEAAGPACGVWAYDALRIARGEPRFGLDTDHRTIPNEVGWIDTAVHMDKGCYRGQETVARVHNLGRPPRRLTLLHLDGSENLLPQVGSELRAGEKVVGRVGTSARHHELGPIALALVKRNVPLSDELDAGGLPAAQEVIVDPEIGRHFRPLKG